VFPAGLWPQLCKFPGLVGLDSSNENIIKINQKISPTLTVNVTAYLPTCFFTLAKYLSPVNSLSPFGSLKIHLTVGCGFALQRHSNKIELRIAN
jgi:hypothetical protein